MARVLLLVPTAGYRSADFLDAARQLDIEVIVACDREPPMPLRHHPETHEASPGTDPHGTEADAAGRILQISFDDVDGAVADILELDATRPLDAVVAVDDQGVLVAAAAAERLGLAGNPLQAVAASRDKGLMRQLLHASEVRQPMFAVIPATSTSEQAEQLAEVVGYPCIVKPAGLSGSQGVIRADTPEQLRTAFERTRHIADRAGHGTDALLVEQFIPGPEVALEGLLHAGELETLALFDKPDPLNGPFFEETIYVTPSRISPADQRAAKAAIQSATRAMGLANGPVHAEVRVSGGRAHVIEVASRTIGGLCSRTLSFTSIAATSPARGGSASLEQLVLAEALDRRRTPAGSSRSMSGPRSLPGSLPRLGGSAGVLMIPIPRAGRLVAIEGCPEALAIPGVVDIQVTVPLGHAVAPPPEGDRYLGFVFAQGLDPAQVEAALRRALSVLSVRIGAGPGAGPGAGAR